MDQHLSDFFHHFFVSRDAWNEFAWPIDTLKYRFIDITKVFF
jgi:hypothetical protein